MKKLTVEFWSQLPAELVERTLSFLPVPVLCRFRTVCKKWDSLICNPNFGALCILRARQDARFIVLQTQANMKKGWSFLDLSARRWYTMQRDEELYADSSRVGIVAMEGGLVCQYMFRHGNQDPSMWVSNPIAKTSRRLPSCPIIIGAAMPPVVTMAVDNIGHTHKIFVLLNHGTLRGESRKGYCAEIPLMVIYESTTNRWRKSTIDHLPHMGFRFFVRAAVFLGGLVYALVDSPFKSQNPNFNCQLWSYNYVEDVWKNTGVIIHTRPFHHPELIVSDTQLFLASWRRRFPKTDPGHGPLPEDWGYESYGISEVHLADKTRSTVFQMTEAVMKQVFEVPEAVERRYSYLHLSASCFSNSIVLFCLSTGISIEYDLSTSSWEKLPVEHPLGWGPVCGKPMNLILPEWDRYKHETEVS